jgi:ATP-binding cassette subfamily C protein
MDSPPRPPAPPGPRRWPPIGQRPLIRLLGSLRESGPGGRLGLAALLTLGGAVAEGLGILTLVPLLGLIGVDDHAEGLGRAALAIQRGLSRLGVPITTASILGLYVGLMVTVAVLVRWQTRVNARVAAGLVSHLRTRLHRTLTRASWVRLVRGRAADVTHALTGQVERAGFAAHLVLRLSLDITLIAVYLAGTLYVSSSLTLLVAATGVGLSLLLRRQARLATLLGQAAGRLGRETSGAVVEHLTGIKTVKSYGAEARSIARFEALAHEVARNSVATATGQADVKCRFDIGAVLVLGVVLYIAIRILAVPAAAILILLYAFARALPRLSALQTGIQQLLNVLPDFTAIQDLEADLARYQEAGVGTRSVLPVRRGVELRSVSFRYVEAGEARALADVSLTIPAGLTTAIVGVSGSGKTTLADVVVGLIVPQQGDLLVDGLPLTPELLPAWRAQVAYVPQETFLFHDTIRANLLWARPDAREADLREALRAAAADFVDRLPGGLDTVVGDRGTRLSGGERQRLALARALLRRPAVLVLDEATSSLDSENERRVQEALAGLHGQVTLVVITHRLATVRLADLIYVLEAGRLVESGSWDRLGRTASGRFRAMREAQGLAG